MIVIAAFPKSGNTWLRLFFTAYFNGLDSQALVRDGLHGMPLIEGQAHFEKTMGLPYKIEHLNTQWPEYKTRLVDGAELVFLTHMADVKNGLHAMIPEEARILHLVRHPWAVCTSWAHSFDLSFTDAAAQISTPNTRYSLKVRHTDLTIPETDRETLDLPLGDWSQHADSWMGSTRERLTVRYEDLMMQTDAVFRAILQFCGIGLDEDRFAHALTQTRFARLQQLEQAGWTNAGQRASVKAAKARAVFRAAESPADAGHALGPELCEQLQAYHGQTMNTLGYSV